MDIVQTLTNAISLFYEETDVARFLAFPESLGQGFTVPDPQTGIDDRGLRFDAPGAHDQSIAAILFQTRPNTKNVSWSVRLNANPHLVLETLDNSAPRSWCKLAAAGQLMPTNNEIIFAVSANEEGVGSMTFSDVLVLYTSDRLTIQKQRELVNKP